MSEEDLVPDDEPIPGIFDEVPDDDAITQETDVVPGETITKRTTEDGNLDVDVDTGGVDPYDHTAEAAAVRESQEKDGVAPPELPETQPELPNNPTMMTDANATLQNEMEARFQQEFGDLKVEVTHEERADFVRAALYEEELIFKVEVEGIGAVVEIAIPSDEFTNSAAAAVNKWGRDGIIDKESDIQWILSFQQLHAWYQIRSVNGTPTPWSKYWAGGDVSFQEIRSYMEDVSNFEEIINMSAVRWRLLIQAVRIAETKYKICLQNWNDRSFFTGAGTD